MIWVLFKDPRYALKLPRENRQFRVLDFGFCLNLVYWFKSYYLKSRMIAINLTSKML